MMQGKQTIIDTIMNNIIMNIMINPSAIDAITLYIVRASTVTETILKVESSL